MIDIGDFLTSRKGRNGMAEDFVALMQAIAPEMAEAMARRAMVLTAIAESAPVGRPAIALRLNLAEREVRADVEKLRDAGLITLDKAGMNRRRMRHAGWKVPQLRPADAGLDRAGNGADAGSPRENSFRCAGGC